MKRKEKGEKRKMPKVEMKEDKKMSKKSKTKQILTIFSKGII